MSRRFAVLLVIALVVPVEAFDEPDTFRRIPWGASVDEATAILEKSHETMPPQLKNLAKPRCTDGSLCVTHVMIGPVLAKASLQFKEGGFVGGSFSFKASRYTEIRAIFIEKYGLPSMQKREGVRTRGGQESVNEVLKWNGQKVLISLTRYSGNINEGGGSVILRGAQERRSEEDDTAPPRERKQEL